MTIVKMAVGKMTWYLKILFYDLCGVNKSLLLFKFLKFQILSKQFGYLKKPSFFQYFTVRLAKSCIPVDDTHIRIFFWV